MSTIATWQPAADRVTTSDDPVRMRVQSALQPYPAPTLKKSVLAEGRQRSSILLEATGDEPALLLKRHRLGTGPHPWRERLKHWLGVSAPQREWRALCALHGAGVAVARPLALATTTDGDCVLVQEYTRGLPLSSGVPAEAPARRAILSALGEEVHRLHKAGFTHGDLHLGNVLAGDDGVTLLDWQRARKVRPGSPHPVRDLGVLDFALAQRGVSRCDRVRVRRIALGAPASTREPAPPSLGESFRESLRDVGRASRAAAERHSAVRTRQALRTSDRATRFDLGHARGHRLRGADPELLARLIEAHTRDAHTIERGRAHAISQVEIAGRRYRVHEAWDEMRRSPIRHALLRSTADDIWRAAAGLAARGIETAQPLCRLSVRRLGLPRRSLCVLDCGIAGRRNDGASAPNETLRGTLARRGVSGARLDAIGVMHTNEQAGPSRPMLIDLSMIRFARWR